MSPHDVNSTERLRPDDDYLRNDWRVEEAYWLANWRSRPYTSADLGFDFYGPAYRYGFERARRHPGRRWEEVENELRAGWDGYEHRSKAVWANIKEAVLDGWNRAIGR